MTGPACLFVHRGGPLLRPGGLGVDPFLMSPALVRAGRLAGASLLRLQTDRRLVDLARAGNRDAFAIIADRYCAELIRHAERLVGADRAEDAVQQALINAHRALERPDADVADLRPWLHRIVRNAALNLLRQPGGSDEPLDERLPGGESPAQAYERRQRLATTLAAVGALPERQRRAILMRELDGLSHDEIALELGVAPGAVRQLIHRARHGVRAAASAVIPFGLFLPRSGGVAAGLTGAGAGGGAAAAGATGIGAKVCVTLALGAGVVGVTAQPSRHDGAPPAPRHGAAAAAPVTSDEHPAATQQATVLGVEAPASRRARATGGASGDAAGEARGRAAESETAPRADRAGDPRFRRDAAAPEGDAGRRDGDRSGGGSEEPSGRQPNGDAGGTSDGARERVEDDSADDAEDASDDAPDNAEEADDGADDAADAKDDADDADDAADDAAEDAADDAADEAERKAENDPDGD